MASLYGCLFILLATPFGVYRVPPLGVLCYDILLRVVYYVLCFFFLYA